MATVAIGAARLIRLGRIDAAKPHVLAIDDDGIAVITLAVPTTSACAEMAVADSTAARKADILI
jgi:hypothetical protein